MVSRGSPIAHHFFIKIKNTIFWNFLIRYFQASFIGFNIAALTVVQKSGGDFKDMSSSIVILTLQYSVIVSIAYLLLKTDLKELNKLSVRQKIGNLYPSLDTTKRYKVMFSLLFYIQRCFIVVLVAIRFDFGI